MNHKLWLWATLGLVLATLFVHAGNYFSQDSFDSGTSVSGISDISIEITVPSNSTIINASLTLSANPISKLYKGSIASEVTGIWGITDIPGSSDFYVTNGSTTIFRINATGSVLSSKVINQTCNAVLALSEPVGYLFGIYAVSNDIVYVVDRHTNNAYNEILKINYTKGSNNGCIDRFFLAYKEQADSIAGVYVNPTQTRMFVSSKADTGYIFQQDITNCTGYESCWLTTGWTQNKTTVGILIDAFDTDNYTQQLYAQSSWVNTLYSLNSTFGTLASYYMLNTSTIDGNIMTQTLGMAYRNGTFWVTDRNDLSEIARFVMSYPKNVRIYYGNGTQVYSSSGDFTGTVSGIDLGATAITSYMQSHTKLGLTVNASLWGSLTVSGLDIWYEDLWECDGRAGEHPSYNFSIYDEDNNTRLTGDISVDITYSGFTLSYTKSNVHSLALCIGGSNNYTVSGTVYSDVGYQHKHFLAGSVFTPTLNSVRLYNFPDGKTGLSTVQFITRDYSYTAYPGLIVKMQRYYPANHTWLTVQQDQTGEFGETVFQVHEEDTDYKFYFYTSTGTFLDNTNSVKFVCDEFDVCYVEYQVVVPAASGREIYPSYTYNNDTKMVTVSWNDPSGTTSEVEIAVYKLHDPDNIKICNTTVYTSSGSYVCNVTGYTGSGMVVVRSCCSNYDIDAVYFVNYLGLPQLFNFISGAESALWSAGMFMVIVGLGITGTPVAVVIMAVVALWFISMLGLSSLVTFAMVGTALCIGVVIAVLVKK